MEDRADWIEQLNLPLPGQKNKQTVRRPTAAEMESEGADFMKFMGEMTG